MATHDLSFSDEIVLTTSSTSPQIYGTIYEANIYFANRLKSETWENANDVDKLKSLIEATRTIDSLKLKGTKLTNTQILEFPRNWQIEIPENIKYACYEIAIALLDESNLESALTGETLKRGKYGSVEDEYFETQPRKYVVSGVLSVRAWRYLKPYLDDDQSVKLTRES